MLLKESVRMRPSEVGKGRQSLHSVLPSNRDCFQVHSYDFEKDPKDSSPCQLPYSGSHHKSTPSPLRRLDLGSCHSPGALTP